MHWVNAQFTFNTHSHHQKNNLLSKPVQARRDKEPPKTPDQPIMLPPPMATAVSSGATMLPKPPKTQLNKPRPHTLDPSLQMPQKALNSPPSLIM